MSLPFTLVSHALCPYVQRIAIALFEKGFAFERVIVDQANKPDWFLKLSPVGRTPVLRVGDAALFESAAILAFLEKTLPHPLHPADPVDRARHRAWIGFASECLNDIAGFYMAPDSGTLQRKAAALNARFRVLRDQLGSGPWFAGDRFSLVDAVFAPVFRFFDTFERVGDFGTFDGLTRMQAWRRDLARRPSVRNAVAPDYDDRLVAFLRRNVSAPSRMMGHSRTALRQSA